MTRGASQLVQATAVAIEGCAVLITGKPGSGKSTLALALIDRGAQLIGDDGVTLSRTGDAIQCSAPPNIEGKLEIRGVGLVDLPTTSAPLNLVVNLDQEGTRLPDPAPFEHILDLAIPCLKLAAAEPSTLPLRVEFGLRLHGLPKG